MTIVAAVQMTSGTDVDQNLSDASILIAKAVAAGAKLVVLPEMFATMLTNEQEKISVSEPLGKGPIQDFLKQQASLHHIWLVGGTIALKTTTDTHKVFAACLVYDDTGQLVCHYNKIHLFDVSIKQANQHYQESASIEAGHEVKTVTTPWGKVGLSVCYDIRFPELYRKQLAKGVEILTIPAAFTVVTGHAHWEILVRARAIENLSYVIAACQYGQHDNGRSTYGGSMIINPWGEILAQKNDGAGIITANIDLDYLHQLRCEFPALSHRKI